MDCQAIDYKNIPVQSDIIAGIIRLDLESNNCFRDLENYVRSDQGLRSLAAEQQIFGCDHCAVGRAAVAQWKLPERFNDYMGTDLAMPPAAGAATPLRRDLLAGNALVAGLGIGAQALPDLAARLAALQTFGLDAAQCEPLLSEEFIAGLMENDSYQLCANL